MTAPELEAGAALAPAPTKGHVSVAKLQGHWYVGCRSEELGATPLARTLLGQPLVLFRDGAGQPGALLDRCPHRNTPLSFGRVCAAGHLECGYHGWQFDRGGACREVPGLLRTSPNDAANRSVPAHAACERDGFVWIWGRANSEPRGEPFRVPLVDDPAYVKIRREFSFECTLHAALENALDVPHTAFLHRGRFRGGVTNEIEAVRRRIPGGLEVEYLGERRGPGETRNRPDGEVIQHWDRFFLPSVAQVEYKDSKRHFLVSVLHTPVSDFETRAWFVQCLKLPLPAFLVRRLVGRSVDRVLAQDQGILARQTAAIRRFGGEQYMSTDLDLMGPEIWRMLKQAERGLDVESADIEARVRLRV